MAKMDNGFNFGKERWVFERGRTYIQTAMFVVQWIANIAVAIKIYDVNIRLLIALAALSGIGLLLFVRFMRFDINRNAPAEFEWIWRVNPEWQKHKKNVERLEKKLDQIAGQLDS